MVGNEFPLFHDDGRVSHFMNNSCGGGMMGISLIAPYHVNVSVISE
jgi:hypothetical protein